MTRPMSIVCTKVRPSHVERDNVAGERSFSLTGHPKKKKGSPSHLLPMTEAAAICDTNQFSRLLKHQRASETVFYPPIPCSPDLHLPAHLGFEPLHQFLEVV
ncbi:hypothetical protein N7G274_008177 [Stereocaulon virgatum]|uniref:Uncharacterized protein n=1 Tax=Stereocaulon virgatum TaxID=373712 RepID=A0ABR4A734_9LECA